jgi:peptidoglycan/LPS O-acetylase OafA/YrhL
MVILFHYEQQEDQFFHVSDATFLGCSLRQLVQHGYLWVDLFFILSGYILYKKYGDMNLASFTPAEYAKFILLRLARTYPVYIVMLIVIIGVWMLEPTHNVDRWPSEMFTNAFGTVSANVLLIQVWGLAPSINSPSWSLSVEWLAYLLFPVLASCMYIRSRAQAFSTATVLCGAIIFLVSSPTQSGLPMDYHDFFEPHTVMRGLVGFMLGGLICRAEFYPQFEAFISRPWVPMAVAVAVLTLLMKQRTEWIVILAFPLLISSFAHAKGLPAKALNAKWFAAAGALSYSVYLLHDQLDEARLLIKRVLASANGTYDHLIYLFASFVFVYAISALIYLCIEKPARKCILRLAMGGSSTHRPLSATSTASANPDR